MIEILLSGPAFEQDIRELLMAFYPGETFVHERTEGSFLTLTGNFVREEGVYQLSLSYRGRGAAEDEADGRHYEASFPVPADDRLETKNRIKRGLYSLLSEAENRTLPWGTLTGIRPAKIALTQLAGGRTEEEIFRYMKENYFSDDEKIRLCIRTAAKEKSLLDAMPSLSGYSLYVGIPFCPTTCLYCSFASYPVERYEERIGDYLSALFAELAAVAEMQAGQPLSTIYIGGGTPTSLSPGALELLLGKLEELFDLSGLLEFTVEAGRPDSITGEKLTVLRRHKVTRISINPQTMNQRTLDLIGRRHTVGDVEEKFHLARSLGFLNINMDLIVGLPGEEPADLSATLSAVKRLGPDSLTVHSLAIKRASRLNIQREDYRDFHIKNTPGMIAMTARAAEEMSLSPYYLYRQKNMAGNFENVGYARPGAECLYNILMMEEQQTIVGCGAGTATKRLFPAENRVERCENVKNLEQYMDRIAEMIGRKRKLLLSDS